ncbi:hypothetical protein [Solitalea canadensis]|uniref:Uncharacterized protein n=1 Tax=Solitalea canadensis (strain ATCC 29591 / DSM 3403 / JCM 21819 / LMG 8368 / NBRC 15130 / NCIMB 12057 / USAM 9D) TaxID=929556 RepID=H8KUS6_SOLCM|nr:hypothetical protein [Solitalea canadensis]AFD07560.1 hypothetical protein Solca_2526 [Solitalea canadensis DSM 3403]
MKTINLVIERQGGQFWGRTIIEDDLLTDYADTKEELKTKIHNLAIDFHGQEYQHVRFDVEYDLEAFFDEFKELKTIEIAHITGLDPTLVHQYALGEKTATAIQVQKIEDAVHDLGRRLQAVKLNG